MEAKKLQEKANCKDWGAVFVCEWVDLRACPLCWPWTPSMSCANEILQTETARTPERVCVCTYTPYFCWPCLNLCSSSPRTSNQTSYYPHKWGARPCTQNCTDTRHCFKKQLTSCVAFLSLRMMYLHWDAGLPFALWPPSLFFPNKHHTRTQKHINIHILK